MVINDHHTKFQLCGLTVTELLLSLNVVDVSHVSVTKLKENAFLRLKSIYFVLKFLSIPREQCNNLFIYDSSRKSPHHPWLVLLKQTLQWFNQKCQNFTKIQAQTLNSTYTIVSWFLFIMKFHLYIPEKDKWL